ncbi:MAG: ECF transporter S component [Tissierellia bacterium]|nr:ECF transporter S component [Tissierellia bacterium]
MKKEINTLKSIKTFTAVSMLIALSAVGALVKIFNTVALDSMPGYFAALYLGSWYGALVISFGHIATAITSGFPLGIPVHLYIAVIMAVCAYSFKFFTERYNSFIGILVGTLLNGPIAALLFVPLFGWGYFIGWSIPLAFGSFVNIFLATLVYKGINKVGGM